MAQRFQITRLGSTKADIAATSTVNEKVATFACVLVGGAVLFFGGRAIVRGIKKRQGAKDIAKAAEERVDKNNLTYSDKEYKAIAAALKSAMQDNDYNEETIEAQLKKIKNQDDWNRVVSEYGADSQNRDLTTALGEDGFWDKSTYRNILKKANVTAEF